MRSVSPASPSGAPATRAGSRWSRAATRIWLAWVAFAVLVVLVFAVIASGTEGYAWLMAILVLWGSAFMGAAPAAACAGIALLRGSPSPFKDGIVLVVSVVAAALSAPGAYWLARGLSEWVPAILRCTGTKC